MRSPLRLRVRELRQALNLTQDALAQASGVSRTTIVEIEGEQTKGVDFLTLDRLARVLNVEPGFLIVRKPEQSPPKPPRTRRGGKA